MVDIEHREADVTLTPACRGREHDRSGGDRRDSEGISEGFAVTPSMEGEGSFWDGRHLREYLRNIYI
jgi:hypothetical protein